LLSSWFHVCVSNWSRVGALLFFCVLPTHYFFPIIMRLGRERFCERYVLSITKALLSLQCKIYSNTHTISTYFCENSLSVMLSSFPKSPPPHSQRDCVADLCVPSTFSLLLFAISISRGRNPIKNAPRFIYTHIYTYTHFIYTRVCTHKAKGSCLAFQFPNQERGARLGAVHDQTNFDSE